MDASDRWGELSSGDEFAGYRVEQLLGRGGMGVLYLAIEPGLERRVALKLIAPEAATDEIFARRFAEESRIAASIEHPNVVPIYAAGEEGGVPFIAMRYVSGSDLGARVRREGRLELAIATALIAQVGNGLDAIHAAGLVHRDVKPANVLLSGATDDEHAYITDFGVARNVATASGLTQTGRFVGTLDYVAPEQISGGEVDARADVYALGCLLFKLLTGEVPYPKDGEAARLYAHLNDPPPAPSLYAQEVPMALDDVVIRAMSKAPEDRYPSAGDLGRAALAALSGDRPGLPERTVATGAAATRTAETIAIAEADDEGAEVATSAPEPTAKTRRLQRERTRGPDGNARRSRGRPWVAAIVGLAIVAALVVGALVLGGDGGSGGGGSSGTAANASNEQGTRPGDASKPGPTAEPLSSRELISRADRICDESQSTYKSIRDPAKEEVPDVDYARQLVGISTPGLRKLNELVPPAALKAKYDEYVRAQKRVNEYDRQALEAAEVDDSVAYVEARESRDAEQPERERLAREIGFEVCSIPRQ